MTPDVAVLAQQLAGYLAPLLPLLSQPGDPGREAAGDRRLAVARAVWARLRPELGAGPTSELTLRARIEAVLRDDPALAWELADLIAEVQPRNPQIFSV